MAPDTPLSHDVFDVIIIGAGVVGCAVARRFVLEGAKVAIVEKARDILDGASKANSAILHTGFDAPPGSLELSCIQDGYREYCDIHQNMGLPFEKNGAFVVAWSNEDAGKLEAIIAKAHNNGVNDCRLISARELLRHEPALASHAKAAMTVPGESIIDPWSAPYTYLQQGLDNGGNVFLSCEVISGTFQTGQWALKTSRGVLKGRHIINCAGLYGDLLDEKLLGKSDFTITPRKGQFVVFDKAAAQLLNSTVLPVPTSHTKGVVLFPTVFGNLAVGPTAEDQQSRCDTSSSKMAIRDLIASGVEKLPALKNMPVTAVYAGLRPASQFQDYQISANPEQNWITIGAIRSTGLSSALGIASYVFKLYQKSGAAHTALPDPSVPAANRLAQSCPRDWQSEGYGEIICHCELVTSREIESALTGPLAARSLQGLKRQTRATMGRCQGFFCSAKLARMTHKHFAQPLPDQIDED